MRWPRRRLRIEWLRAFRRLPPQPAGPHPLAVARPRPRRQPDPTSRDPASQPGLAGPPTCRAGGSARRSRGVRDSQPGGSPLRTGLPGTDLQGRARTGGGPRRPAPRQPRDGRGRGGGRMGAPPGATRRRVGVERGAGTRRYAVRGASLRVLPVRRGLGAEPHLHRSRHGTAGSQRGSRKRRGAGLRGGRMQRSHPRGARPLRGPAGSPRPTSGSRPVPTGSTTTATDGPTIPTTPIPAAWDARRSGRNAAPAASVRSSPSCFPCSGVCQDGCPAEPLDSAPSSGRTVAGRVCDQGGGGTPR